MLPLSISNAKKDSNIYKKIQWNIAQNSELAAGNGDKGDFGKFAALHSARYYCIKQAYTSPWRNHTLAQEEEFRSSGVRQTHHL